MGTGKLLGDNLANKATSELLDILSIAARHSEIKKKISKKGSDTSENFKNKFEELLICLNNKFTIAK